MATPAKLIKLQEDSVLDDPKYDVCLQHVFAWLSIADRYKMRGVCKRWQRISEIPWKDMTRLNCYDCWSNPGSCVSKITYFELGEVLRLCGDYLTHFDFSGNYPAICSTPIEFDADVRFFSLLATHCPNLKILDIYILTPTPSGVEYMANNYNKVADFRIYDYDNNCNKALSLFFKKAQKLEAITLYQYGKNDNCLLDLPVETIKEIHVGNICHETANQLVSVLGKCRNLESFSVINSCDKCNVTSIINALTQQSHSLKMLSLDDTYSILPYEASHFAKFHNLQELILLCTNKLNDKILETIGNNCRQLKSVRIMADGVTDRGLKALPNLEYINLGLSSMAKGQFLAHMSKLKAAYLLYCGITDRYLHSLLDTANSLQFLDFRSNEHINIKEFILHASDAVKERKTKIPLEIVLDVESKVKNYRRGLLRVRNAE